MQSKNIAQDFYATIQTIKIQSELSFSFLEFQIRLYIYETSGYINNVFQTSKKSDICLTIIKRINQFYGQAPLLAWHDPLLQQTVPPVGQDP